MSKYLRSKTAPRFRDEMKRTYYCESDRRTKAATLTVVRYSDGRQYRKVQYHNGHNQRSLAEDLEGYMTQLLLEGPEIE